jgi:hypothetical protein
MQYPILGAMISHLPLEAGSLNNENEKGVQNFSKQ